MDSNVLFWIRGVLQTIVGILGLIGNVTAIIILKKPSMKSCINYILLGMNSKSSNVTSTVLRIIRLGSILD